MTDQIFILVLAVTLTFAFGVWIGADQARRQMKRKLRQEQFDEWIGEPPPFRIGVQPDHRWPR